MDTEGKTLAELGAETGDFCPDCGLPVPSRNPYCFCRPIVSRATPADPVKLDEGGKAADWPEGVTEMRFGSDSVAIDHDRGMVCLNEWTLCFYPDAARRIGRAMIAAADALLAALEARDE